MLRIILAFIVAPIVGMISGMYYLSNIYGESIVPFLFSLEAVFLTAFTYFSVCVLGVPMFLIFKKRGMTLKIILFVSLGCVLLTTIILASSTGIELKIVQENIFILASGALLSGSVGGVLFWLIQGCR